MSNVFAPAGFWPSRPKPEEASWRSPRIKKENFTVPENLDFSRTGLARYCQKVRKGLPKSSQGIANDSNESVSGVFARDSEVEREEL